MNTSYILLSILIFTSLYIPATTGMERKHEKQIQTFYTTRKTNYINTLPQQSIQLPKEIIINHVTPALKNLPLTLKERSNLRLTCKHYAQKFAQDPSTWSLMPNNVETTYNALFNHNKNILSMGKHRKSNLIIACLAEQNDCKAVKWIINNIHSEFAISLHDETDAILFAQNHQNIVMGEILIKARMRAFNRSEQDIIDNWQTYFYHNYSLQNFMESYLHSEEQNSFFPSYCLAAQLNNVDRLKELCFQTEPTIFGIHKLLELSKYYAPNCFIYLFDRYEIYKNQDQINQYLDDGCCEIVKNYLKKQQSYCTIQ